MAPGVLRTVFETSPLPLTAMKPSGHGCLLATPKRAFQAGLTLLR